MSGPPYTPVVEIHPTLTPERQRYAALGGPNLDVTGAPDDR